MLQLSWDDVDRSVASYPLRILLLGEVALLGLVLFALDRREKPYLWLALACTAYMLLLLIVMVGSYVTWLSFTTITLAYDVVLPPLQFGLWAIFWASWFGLPQIRRIHAIVWSQEDDITVLSVVRLAHQPA